MTTSTTLDDDYTLLNRRIDGDSSYWKKKYTMLMKKTETIETVRECSNISILLVQVFLKN